MRHIGQPPIVVRVVGLVFAAVILTLGIQHGPSLEQPSSEELSFVHSIIAVQESAGPAGSETADPGGEAVHCPYHCLRVPGVRPRAGYLWYTALLVAGLLIASACYRRWYVRPRTAGRTAGGTAGAELLLRLCVCRR
ncbi:hypothetical protein [Nocardia carnea]|uniref:hypothetical protein n=1 Tax=Nocardia carnea TaxID=37328 RepID=UPI002456AD6E|nr:hypothetical protein [Nocardia carnea]